MPNRSEYRAPGSQEIEPTAVEIRLTVDDVELVRECLADASDALSKRLELLADREELELESLGSTPDTVLTELRDRHAAIEALSLRLAKP